MRSPASPTLAAVPTMWKKTLPRKVLSEESSVPLPCLPCPYQPAGARRMDSCRQQIWTASWCQFK